MNQETAEKILKETERGYDLIEGKFSETRKHFWRGLEFIADYAREGDKVLDFGCGNGRLLELFSNKNIDYLGVDVSEKLVAAAQEKYGNEKRKFQKISGSENLEFADNYFNTIYSIAVFHHFPSQKYREDMARELYRTTNGGGHVVTTVWNLWPASTRRNNCSSTRGGQKRYIKNILRNWKNKIFGKSSLDWSDCYISFSDNGKSKIQRFHHAFTKRELKKLFQKVGFRIEKCETINGRNILLIGKK